MISVIHIETSINHGETFKTVITSSSNGLIARDMKNPDIQKAFFIPSFLRVSSRNLTREFDKARLDEKDAQVLKAFQVIEALDITANNSIHNSRKSSFYTI